MLMKNKKAVKIDHVVKPATVEQVDIYNTDFNLVWILVIRALAGTGKTTTLIELARLNPSVQYLYIALNASIVADVKKAIKKAGITNLKASTIHSLAYEASALYRNGRDVEKLTIEYVQEYLNIRDSFTAYSIVSMMEKYCNQAGSFHDFSDLIMSQADDGNPASSFKIKKASLNGVQSLLEGFENGSIDFITHSLYLKHFIDNQSLISEDCLMVDESQDLNSAMFSFVESQIELGVHNVIAVGDQNQSIYGFIGSKDIMQILQDKYGAVVKTLTRSFRFAAKTNMESFANNFLSIRGENIYGAALHSDAIIRNRAYLGRTNMQILGKCIELIKNGESFSLLGGIKSIDFASILDVWYLSNAKKNPEQFNKIQSEIVKSFESKEELKKWAVENDFHEYIGACSAVDKMYFWMNDIRLHEIMEECGFIRSGLPFPKQIFNLVDRMSKKSSYTIVSTFHKSKGLGVDRVEIMRYEDFSGEERPVIPYGLLHDKKKVDGEKIKLIDNKYSTLSGQTGFLLKLDPMQTMLFDEYNLMYVAVTRAKKEMIVKDRRLVASANCIAKLYEAYSNNITVIVQKDTEQIECFPVFVEINSQLNFQYFIPRDVGLEFLRSVQQRVYLSKQPHLKKVRKT